MDKIQAHRKTIQCKSTVCIIVKNPVNIFLVIFIGCFDFCWNVKRRWVQWRTWW